MIHINVAREMLDSGKPVTLSIFTKKGELQTYADVIGISSYFRGGTRKIKFLVSGEIRQIRDVCIVEINDEEVYL